MKSPVRPLPLWSKATLLVVIVAAGLLWAGTAEIDGRVVMLRMFLFFVSALIAFITPYMLFPDSSAPLMQLGNADSSGLIQHLFRKVSVFWSSVILFIATICFGDIQAPLNELSSKLIYFLHGSFFITGLLFYSVSRYTQSGKNSQFWKESEKGKRLRANMGEYFKYPIDPGAIPSFINTVLIGALGMIAVSVGATLYGNFGSLYELIPSLILISVAGISITGLRKVIPSNYYASSAFFNEFFGETIAGKEQEGKVEVYQLWWVPKPIKSHVWATLLQLDRKFPAGRILFAGHLLIWILSYQRPGDELMVTAWILFSLFHHILIVISLSSQFSPLWFQRWIGSATEWVFVRIWIQFRWILILVGSMLFNSWIFGHVSYSAQGAILLFYIGSATAISLISHFFKNVYS